MKNQITVCKRCSNVNLNGDWVGMAGIPSQNWKDRIENGRMAADKKGGMEGLTSFSFVS